MTTVQKPFNLLFSLPDELITEIYGTFDPTYRIFHTPEFRNEIEGSSGWLNVHKKTIRDILCELTEVFILNGEFVNEFGYYGEDVDVDIKNKKLIEYTEDNFEIYLHPATKNYMYYKVLPKGSTKDNCSFLRNPRRFDGFVCYEQPEDNDDYEFGFTSWEKNPEVAAKLLTKCACLTSAREGFYIFS